MSEPRVFRPDDRDPELDYLPLKDALEVLGISRRSFYRAAREGLISKTRHGGRTYVSRSAIRDYAARLQRDAEIDRVRAERAARSRS